MPEPGYDGPQERARRSMPTRAATRSLALRTSRARRRTIAPTRLHHQTCARILRHDRQVQRAQRADRRRLGRGADAEQDHREHHDGEHAERHHRGDQLLQDLELLAVHAPEVVRASTSAENAANPQNHSIEVRGDLAPPPRRAGSVTERHLLGRRVRRSAGGSLLSDLGLRLLRAPAASPPAGPSACGFLGGSAAGRLAARPPRSARRRDGRGRHRRARCR